MKDLLSQAHMWPQGWNSTAAFLSEQTTHSSIWNRTNKWAVWSLGWLVHLKLKWVGVGGEEWGGITLVLDWTWSLQMRHFFTRGEQREQVAMCPQGPNSVSLFMSEHTMHSSSDSMLLFRDGLRVPTCPLDRSEENNSECVRVCVSANKRLSENKWGSDDVNKEENMLPPSAVMAEFLW